MANENPPAVPPTAADALNAALDAVRAARSAANLARNDPNSTHAQKQAAATAFFDLDDLESQLVLDQLSKNLASIRAGLTALGDVKKGLTGTIQSLNTVAKLIDGVVSAVGTLLQVASLAAKV